MLRLCCDAKNKIRQHLLKSGIKEKSRLLSDSEQLIQVLENMKSKDPRVKFAYEFTEEVK